MDDFITQRDGDFVSAVLAELDYQATRWADGSRKGLLDIDTEKNSPNDLVAFIAHHSSRWFPGGFPPYSVETLNAFQQQMVKVAALALSAHHSADIALEQMAFDTVTGDQDTD